MVRFELRLIKGHRSKKKFFFLNGRPLRKNKFFNLEKVLSDIKLNGEGKALIARSLILFGFPFSGPETDCYYNFSCIDRLLIQIQMA